MCLPAFPQDAVQGQKAQTTLSELSDEDAIRLVVLQKIIGPWIKDRQESLSALYIAVDGDKDPSQALLARFDGLSRPVMKASKSFISHPEGSVVKDKKTKKDGVLLTISRIKWKSKDEVTVTAGSYLGNMGSDGCRYKLKRIDGTWVFVAEAECYIS
jgi:hypothetical protein